MEFEITGAPELAALALAAVFVVAAAAKLRHPRATARSLSRMGLPFPRVLAIAVPGTELVTAALLLFEPFLGAALALVVFVFFTAVLVMLARAPKPEPCNCFGSRSTRPVSWGAVVRNLGLSALAVLALFATPVLTL